MSRPRYDLTTLFCTVEALRECVLEQHMTPRAIAAQFGVSASRVRSALRVLDLPSPATRRGATQPGDILDRYYATYQKSAAKRHHVFAALVNQPCFYCGAAPATKRGERLFSGIDRIDSRLGYILGNVRPCCGTCNLAKWRMSEQDFIAWVLRTADHLRITSIASVLGREEHHEPNQPF